MKVVVAIDSLKGSLSSTVEQVFSLLQKIDYLLTF